ncbi:MAG: replication-associated recombination protein A [Spirochaetota bacterium]
MTDKKELSPLAERCRPKNLEDFIGQNHLMSNGKILNAVFKKGTPFSMILWGEPGSGKTTLAHLIAMYCNMDSYFLSAISAGVGDVRKIIEKGKINKEKGIPTLLVIDEIHRFNKAQQDAVLGAVESGEVVLIGATTENPSFQVISPLLSRTRVIRLKKLADNELSAILDSAIKKDLILKDKNLVFDEGAKENLIGISQGDARRMLNLLEASVLLSVNGKITGEILNEALKDITIYYDRAGDKHYDTISAFIKSLRGSDPDAAVYYLARMLEGGEDPEFIARRMVILASEDVGNASPNAISIATSVFLAVKNIGMPEAEIILSQCATFLASCPKSNASYMAIQRAKNAVINNSTLEIPMHLRNAPTKLMKNMGYHKGYKYPHDYDGHFIEEEYLPEKIKNEVFYKPSEEGSEKSISERLKKLWPLKYNQK